MRLITIFCLFTTSAAAQVCPPAPDHTEQEASLYAQLQALPSPVGAAALSDQLWQLWTDAPDDAAQALLDEGMHQRSRFDLLRARDTLDELIAYCPDYAEGYNQRAFANFLDANYTGALSDLDIALEMSPNHTGVLTGKALTLMRLGRDAEAQALLKAAVALNPWLSERALITAPAGEDI